MKVKIKGMPGVRKRGEALRLYPSLEQVRRDSDTGEVLAVMHRTNRKP